MLNSRMSELHNVGKLESFNLQILESSQTPGNEFFGLQRNIWNWANSPILQTRAYRMTSQSVRTQSVWVTCGPSLSG